MSTSLYTEVVLFFFSFFPKTSASLRARENEHGARERKIKNACRHLWEKWGLLSFFFPHHYPFALAVNKSPAVYILSPALDGLWRENKRFCEQAKCRPILSVYFVYLFLTRVNYFFGAANLKCHNKECKIQSSTPALAHIKWVVLIQWTYLVVNQNIVTVTRWKCDTMFLQGLKEEVKRTVVVTLTRGVHWSWCVT